MNTRFEIERFSIECRKTKTNPIRLLSQSQTVLKPKPKQKQLFNYFRHSIENRSITQKILLNKGDFRNV